MPKSEESRQNMLPSFFIMKTNILKAYALLIMCSLCASLAFAQDPNSEEPEPGATITPDPTLFDGFNQTANTPIIKSSSVIFYSDGLSIAIEFESSGLTPQNVIFTNESNPSDTRTLSLTAGKTEFFGATVSKTYKIKAAGSDGQTYVVGTINTSPFQAGDPVVVSEKLYRALSQYVTVPTQTTTLSNYLKQVVNVSQHEKISFLQRYVMNGAVLPTSIKGQYPDAFVRSALASRQTEGECICNFVMNQVTVVVPDQTGNNDFQIGPKTTTTGPNQYNNASFWFRGLTSQGPAKHLLLHNAGNKAGSKRRKESWTSGGESISDNSVRIGYHLMCVGINELPKECDCEKTVRYDFGYSTRIEARATTGGLLCVFSNDGFARAQDWAVAVVTREKVNNVSDVQVLQSGLGAASSQCNGGVPVNVIIDAAKIGVSVFQLIKSVKTADLNDIVDQTNQIIDKVGAVLSPIMEAKNCDAALVEKPLLQGTSTITFKPNDPLSFLILSGSVLEVSGLRCWSSEARIKSSFHLAGVVNGGAPSSNSTHCCTNYFANWAYASQNGDENNRRNFINGHLALNSPGGWQTVNGLPNPLGGSISIPTQVGYAMGVNLPNEQRCIKEIPIFNTPH